MPTITWLIKKNAETPVTLAASGITACVLTLKANGVDSLSFTTSADWLGASGWPYGARVCLIRREVDGETTTDVCHFVGTVEVIPRQAVGGGSQALTYTAYGPSFDLQRCEYSQEWAFTTLAGVVSSDYDPIVVLGENNQGDRLKTGEAVEHALSWAVTRGVNIDLGTIEDGSEFPLDERTNIKVWDAIVACLRYTPDVVLWWDYDHQVAGEYVPAANLTSPDNMTLVTKALVGADASTADFTPRTDLQIPGIVVVYHWTGEYDGRQIKCRSTQTAGDTDDPRCVALYYELEGSKTVFISQDIEVEDYPASWADATGKAALLKLIPWLSQLADADWSVLDVSRSGVEAYPARLLSGSVPEWTGKATESETFTVRIAYTMKSDATASVLDKGEKELTFSCVSTDATTGTERKVTEWQEAEAAPADLAASLYGSWNMLHYDGSVTFHSQEVYVDAVPGKRLALTGGLSEWATMDATVQDAVIDIGAGTLKVTTGTCGRLEADNLMAIYRAARGRRYSYNRVGRDNADATDGNQIEGPQATPNDSVADGTPAVLRKRFAVEAADTTPRTHIVDIDPASARDASGGLLSAAQTVKLREVVQPYMDGTTVVHKKRQVLCGDAYGDAVTVGDGKVKGTSADTSPDFLDGKVEMSLTVDTTSKKARLSGDSASPGNYYAYCTNGSGVKGWVQGVQISF